MSVSQTHPSGSISSSHGEIKQLQTQPTQFLTIRLNGVRFTVHQIRQKPINGDYHVWFVQEGKEKVPDP